MDVDESESKPKILLIGALDSPNLDRLFNCSKGSSFVYTEKISDFKDCQGVLLFTLSCISQCEGLFEKAMNSFEKSISSLGGIEGAAVFLFVGGPEVEDEFLLKEKMVKRLRLEERGCVWGFGAEYAPTKVFPESDRLFHGAQANLKPAKKEK